MKNKGLMSFVLVLIFILIYFNLVYSIGEFNSKKNLTEAELIEIEDTSFKRNLLENAVDSVIEETISNEILFGSTEGKKINQKISEKLIKVFSETEAKEIFVKEINSNKEYKKIKITGKEITKEFIEENSKTIVIKLEEKIFLVEFHFTGGINKNNLVGAEITENQSKSKFFIPVNYTVKLIAFRVI